MSVSEKDYRKLRRAIDEFLDLPREPKVDRAVLLAHGLGDVLDDLDSKYPEDPRPERRKLKDLPNLEACCPLMWLEFSAELKAKKRGTQWQRRYFFVGGLLFDEKVEEISYDSDFEDLEITDRPVNLVRLIRARIDQERLEILNKVQSVMLTMSNYVGVIARAYGPEEK